MKHIYFICILFLSACTTTEQLQPIDYSSITTVYISNDIINELNNKFETETLEFSMCLYGEKKGDSLTITSIEEAIYKSRTDERINIVDIPCPNKNKLLIGHLHSHQKLKLCYLSEDDKFGLTNEWGLEGVICRNNKFVFFTYANTITSLKVINNNNDITIHQTDKDFCPTNTNYCRGTCYPSCDSSNQKWICDSKYAYCE